MENEVMDKVDQYIQQMAESLGVAAEYVIQTLTHQMFAEGVAFLSIWSVFVFISIVGLLIGAFKLKFEKDHTGDIIGTIPSMVKIGVLVVSGVIMFFSLALFVNSGQEAILKIINPEYYALKEILDTVKGG